MILLSNSSGCGGNRCWAADAAAGRATGGRGRALRLTAATDSVSRAGLRVGRYWYVKLEMKVSAMSEFKLKFKSCR
jgi:hypothetical protein